MNIAIKKDLISGKFTATISPNELLQQSATSIKQDVPFIDTSLPGLFFQIGAYVQSHEQVTQNA